MVEKNRKRNTEESGVRKEEERKQQHLRVSNLSIYSIASDASSR
jgi:hypothetical protein